MFLYFLIIQCSQLASGHRDFCMYLKIQENITNKVRKMIFNRACQISFHKIVTIQLLLWLRVVYLFKKKPVDSK